MTARCAFVMIWPVCYLVAVFSGSYLALISPHWERGNQLLCFSFVYDMCTVCRGLFPLPLDVISRLCSLSVAFPGHLLYFFLLGTVQKLFDYIVTGLLSGFATRASKYRRLQYVLFGKFREVWVICRDISKAFDWLWHKGLQSNNVLLGLYFNGLQAPITKTRLYNFDRLKHHFYIVELGVYRGIHYFSAPKHRLWVLVRTASARRF